MDQINNIVENNSPYVPEEKLPAQSVPQKTSNKFVTILLIILILTLVVVGFLAYKNYLAIYNKPATTLTDKTQVNSKPILSSDSKIYLLTVSLKSGAIVPPWQSDTNLGIKNLAEYLSGVLGLQKDVISSLLYKTTSSPYSDPYNTSYYALFQDKQQLNKNYSDEYVSIDTEAVSENLLPYLIKNEYCEKDSDCSIRSHMCSEGAYNNYEVYVDGPWGCGPFGYKDIYGFEYGMYDVNLKCNLESLKFEGAKCVKNICTEVGMQKVCMK